MAPSANGRNAKARNGQRQIEGVITQPLTAKSVHPSERLPGWAKPLPNEDVRKYADRLGLAIHLDSMERSLRGDTAAHAKWREQALKGLGLGQRSELDITAHQDQEWLRYLTDEELASLDTLHKTALQRMSVPQTGIIEGTVQAVCNPAETRVHMLTSDNGQSVKFAGSDDATGR